MGNSAQRTGSEQKTGAKAEALDDLGSVHQLTPPHRPYNSLYVISDRGKLITRYDERLLSNTKISFMYSPGTVPVTFEIDGFRFGCALGMEAHYPEIFMEYEKLNVDCVLFSTAGDGPSMPRHLQPKYWGMR